MKGEVAAVLSATEYFSCRFCQSKVVLEGEVLAKCHKCGAIMKAAICKEAKSAKFIVAEATTSCKVELSAFDPILTNIVRG